MTISRGQIKAVALPEERVTVEAIGGEVLIRGFDIGRMLRFQALRSADVEGQSEQDRQAVVITHGLHMGVLLDDGLPVYSVAEWAVFAARHVEVALDLFSKVMRLSGTDLDAEKKA